MQRRKVAFVTGLLVMLAAVGLGSTARAATLYWDTTGGGMTAGNGNWSSTDAYWSTTTTGDPTLSTWPGAGNVADFYPSGSSTVNVLGSVSADGITFAGTGYTLQGSGTINLTSSTPTITVNQAATINASLAGSSVLTITGSTAVLTLGGSNSYTGGTTINRGTVSVATLNDTASSNLGPSGTLTMNGGTLQYTGAGTSDTTGRTLTVITSGGCWVQVTNPAADFTFAGPLGEIGGDGALVTKTGPGTLTIGGDGNSLGDASGVHGSVLQGTLILAKYNTANHHDFSDLMVSAGALVQMGSGATGGAPFWSGVKNMNGTFDLNGISIGLVVLNGAGTVTNSASSTTSILTFGSVPGGASNGSDTFPGVLANGLGVLALSVSSGNTTTATLTLTGTNNTYSGGTTIGSNGMLQIGNGTLPGSLPGNVVIGSSTAGALTFNTPTAMSITCSGNISGSGTGGLTKSGAGTLVLSGSDNYAGPTTISAGTLAFASGSNETLSGGLLGGGALIQQGPGMLTLGGTNTFSGVTTVSGGTLALGSSQALQSSTFSTNGGGVLSAGSLTSFVLAGISGSNSFTIPSGAAISMGVTSGTVSTALIGSGGSLAAIGPGVVTLTASNSYGGGTLVSGGTLVGYSTSLPTAIVLSNSANVSFNQNASGTFGQSISGTGSLTMVGSSSLTLSGSNSFYGTTTVNNGNLAYASASALSPNSSILINSPGAVNVGGPFTTVTGWLNSGVINQASSGALAFTGTSNEAISMAVAGSYSYGGLSLGAVAAGATYSGTLTPSGSTFCLGGGAGALTFTPSITGANGLVVGGTLVMTGSNTYTGPTAINFGTLQFSGSANQSLSGNITGAGALAMTGPGLLTLSGTNTYTGGTTLSGGTLSIPAMSGLGNGGVNLPGTTATLLYTGTGADSTSHALTTPANTSTTVDILNPTANVTFTGGFGGNNTTSIIKSGSGTMTINGGGGSGFFISVQQGTLVLANASSTPASEVSGVNAGATLKIGSTNAGQTWQGVANMNGTLDLNGHNQGFASNLSGSGTVTNNASSTTSTLIFGYTPGISNGGGGTFVFPGQLADGLGTLAVAVSASTNSTAVTLTGTNNAYSGGTTVGAGKLTIGDGMTSPGSLPGNVIISSTTANALTFNTPAGMSITASGNISGGGSGGLTKSGAGTLILTGTNSYAAGPIAINAGVVAFSGSSAVFPVSGNITIASSAVAAGGYNSITSWLPNIATSSAGVLALVGNDPESSASVASYANLVIGASGAAAFSGSFTPAGSTYRLGGGGGTLTFAPNIGGTANLAAFGGGTGGTLILTGSNSYTGTTTITSGGTLEFAYGGSQSLNGGLSGAGALVQQGTGTLTLGGTNASFTGATTVTGGTLTLSSPLALESSVLNTNGGGVLSPGSLTNFALGGVSGSNSFTIPSGSALNLTGGSSSAVLTGGGTLAAIGPGVVTLTSSGNSFSGGTTVSGGTLVGSVATLPTAIALSNGANVTFNQTVPGTFSQAISGNGGLGLTGGNLLTLTGSNSYTGGTTISSGTLAFSNAGNQSLGGNITGGGVLSMPGPGQLTLSGTNTFSGGTFLSGGTLSVAAMNSLGSGGMSLSGGMLLYTGTGTDSFSPAVATQSNTLTTFDFVSPTANVTFTGGLNDNNTTTVAKTGSGTMAINGGAGVGFYISVQQGTLVLANTNGSTAVSEVSNVSPGATLQISSGSATGAGQSWQGVTNMNGTFDLNGRNQGFAGSFSGSGTVTNNAASTAPTLTFGYTPGTPSSGGFGSFAGVIKDGNGTLGLAVSGGATLILTGTNNAYSGGTTVYTGALDIGDGTTSPGSLPGNVVISSTTAGALTFNTPAGMGITASGNISGSGSGGFTKKGSGLLTLSGTNSSYSGGTFVNQGMLEATNAAALPLTGAVNIAGGAVLAVQSSGGASGWSSTQIGSLLTSATWANNTAVLGIDTTNGNFTYGGNITPALALTKLGNNTLTLTGSNTYSGATTVSAGVLQLGSSNAVPSGAGNGDVTVSSGGTLDVFGQSAAINALIGAGTVNNTAAGGATLTLGANGDSGSFSGAIQNTGGALSLTKTGAGVETLTGSSTFSGVTSVSGGTLAGNTASLPAAIALANGANVGFAQNSAGTFSQAISGNGSLSMTGSSLLTLTGSNSYTGATTISSGSLAFHGGSSQTLSGGLLGGGSLIQQGPGALTLSGTGAYSGAVTLSGGMLSVAALNDTSNSNLGTGQLNLGGGTLQYTGTGDFTNRTVTTAMPGTVLQVSSSSADLILNGTVNGPNATALTKTGPGMLTLSSTTAIDDGGLYVSVVQGTLVLAHTNTFYGHAVSQVASVSPGAVLLMGTNGSPNQFFSGVNNMNGTFDLNGMNETLTILTGSGTVTNGATSTAGTLTFGSVPNSGMFVATAGTTFSGVIQDGLGTVALAVSDTAAVITLTGSNGYSGGTTVSAGILRLSGTGTLGAVTGALTVDGGLLDLNGTSQSLGAFGGGGGTVANNGSGTSVFTVGNGGGSGVYGGVLLNNTGGTGALALVKTGSGTLALNGTNTITGGTTINAGVLQMGNSAALGNPGLSLTLAVNSGGTLDMNGNSPTFASLSGNGVIGNSSTGGYAVFNYDNSSTSSTFGGSIRDRVGGGIQTVGLVVGSGTLTLTGSNAYSRTTEVDSELLLGPGGSLGNTLVKVGGNATFGTALSSNGGTASIGGTLYLYPGSTLTLVDGSTNVLNASGGTLAGANLKFDVSSVAADELLLGSLASVSGTNTIAVTSLGSSLSANSYTLISDPSGGLGSGFTLSSSTVNAGGTIYNIALTSSTTAEILTVSLPVTGPSAWTLASSGSWSTPGNWTGPVPSGSGQTAVLNASTSSAVTITLDEPVTLGTLQFGGSSSVMAAYTLSGSETNLLTLSNSGSGPAISVTGGTQAISAPITLAGNLTVTPSAGARLSISGAIGQSGTQSLTLAGPGTLILSGTANSYTGGTYVNQGTLYVQNSGAIYGGTSLTVGAGGTFIFDPTVTAGTSMMADVSPSMSMRPASQVEAVPEPGTLALLSVAGIVAAAAVWRRRRTSGKRLQRTIRR